MVLMVFWPLALPFIVCKWFDCDWRNWNGVHGFLSFLASCFLIQRVSDLIMIG